MLPLIALLALSVPSSAAASPVDTAAPIIVVADDEPGFVERYFPLQMNSPLDAQVEDLRLLFFVGGLLPLGQVWVPLVGGLDVDDAYFLDALLIAAVHLFPHLALLILVVATPIAVIPVIGWIVVASIYLLNAINIITFVANNFYFTPVAIVNEADRHALGAGAKPKRKKKSPPERRKKHDARAPSSAHTLVLGPSVAPMAF